MTETLSVVRRAVREEADDVPSVADVEEAEKTRPVTRGDCANGPRPCPRVWCRMHLGVEPTSGGGVRYSYPDHPLGIRPRDDDHRLEGESCAQDVADRGGSTLEEIGFHMNLTRERVRQIEVLAMEKFKRRCRELGIDPEDAFFHPTRDR